MKIEWRLFGPLVRAYQTTMFSLSAFVMGIVVGLWQYTPSSPTLSWLGLIVIMTFTAALIPFTIPNTYLGSQRAKKKP